MRASSGLHEQLKIIARTGYQDDVVADIKVAGQIVHTYDSGSYVGGTSVVSTLSKRWLIPGVDRLDAKSSVPCL